MSNQMSIPAKLASILIILFAAACSNDKPQSNTEKNSTNNTHNKDTNMTSETSNSTVLVELETSKGTITLELNKEKAPATVNNFLNYLEAGHYNGTVFHRVIPGFMIQGGGFEPGMKQKKTNAPVLNEANNGLQNNNLTIAMARTGDPHSATAQFFINVKDNDFLNFSSETQQGWGYTVFGQVVEGGEAVKAIETVATGQSGGHGDVPQEDVLIVSAKVKQ